MRFLSHLLLLIIAVDGMWEVVWEPHEANVALVVVTRCDGRVPFFAYNRIDITPAQSSAQMRQV